MASFRLSRKAQADLREITAFYLKNANREVAARNIATIRADINYIAQTPMIGKKTPGLSATYRYWYALDTKYKVYFRQLGPSLIRVLRIYPSRANPLTPTDIDV